jgi:outer membrane protein TolC
MLLAMMMLSACSQVPPAPGRNTALAAHPFTDTDTVTLAPLPADSESLRAFPELEALVQASLAANADLRVAYATVDRARASAAEARALRLPQSAIESSLRFDDRGSQPGVETTQSTDFDVAAAASWDVDLFGRLRAAALASRADADASAAAFEGLRLVITAETVNAYLDHCAAIHGADALRAAIAAQDRLSATFERQRIAGEVSGIEVAQTQAVLASLRASLPVLDAARLVSRYRLAELQGRPPAEAAQLVTDCRAIPLLGAAIPVGDGQALLLRRPDIREAERRLAAATARIGVARAELYPRLNLGGAVGLLTGGLVANATPFLVWSFPNQSPARARIAQAEAGERAALANWDSTVLRALREVETAITVLEQETRRNTQLGEAASAAERLALRSAARVRLGDAAPLLRHDADRVEAQARLAKLQSDIALARSQFTLLRLLGAI